MPLKFLKIVQVNSRKEAINLPTCVPLTNDFKINITLSLGYYSPDRAF